VSVLLGALVLASAGTVARAQSASPPPAEAAPSTAPAPAPAEPQAVTAPSPAAPAPSTAPPSAAPAPAPPAAAPAAPGLPVPQLPPTDRPPVADRGWGFDTGLDGASRYLFRGESLLGKNGVLTPHARYGIGNFAAYAYGYAGRIPRSEDRFRELDLGADYTFWLGTRAALTAGAVTYRYGRAAQNDLVFLDTYELYAIVALDTLLSPTVSFYRDMDAVKGGFLTVSAHQDLALSSRLRAVFGGALGFDFKYNSPDRHNGTFNDVQVSADLPLRIDDHWSAHAMVQRSFARTSLAHRRFVDPAGRDFYASATVVSGGFSFVY
jgi:hypothetical protein